jgi:N4-gp56 family major capsid protein
MTRQYNTGGTTSDIATAGTVNGVVQVGQLTEHYFQKKALIELVKETYFGQLADTTSMPKNMGKKIKRYHYLPMLDDRNVNDQGIDAAGATIVMTEQFVTFPSLTVAVTNASKVAATATINDNIDSSTKTASTVAVAGADGSGGSGLATITLTKQTVRYLNTTKSAAVQALNLGVTVKGGSGNLYGSSKDIGTISGKLPALSESGGRVNRVGFKRIELEGTFEKFGFFDEYTQESMDFDSDADLMMHVNREMLRGANEITEDALQIDLINAAGVIRYAGAATSNATLVEASLVTYGDLMRLSIDLDNNRTPKSTKIITGSRMVDTKVLPACRVAYMGSELLPTFKAMVDLHGDPAWLPVEKYASGGTLLNGEAGAVDAFRIVVVPEMLKWAGGGGDASASSNSYETNGRFDVFPILVVGSDSFTTIGFQTDGKTVKFKIMHKAPGEATADRTDPFGETGFMSIKWYYGFMTLRGERIALVKTVARL